ncbi:MAG: response regulator [Magnetococcus sp. DMHC-8]
MNTVSAKIKWSVAVMAVVLSATVLFNYWTVMSSKERYRQVLAANFQEVELAHDTGSVMLRAHDEWEKNIQEPEHIENLLRLSLHSAVTLQRHQVDHGHAQGAELTSAIMQEMQAFRDSFRTLVRAWQIKGSDHESGLFGVMREDAHALERLLGNFDTAPLQGILGQMRANEKNFALHHQQHLLGDMHRLQRQFQHYLDHSTLTETARAQVGQAMQTYMETVNQYAGERLKTEDATWETARYREMDEASHTLHVLLQTLFVPNALSDYLQARRHEKDYMARLDPIYITKMHHVLETLRNNVRDARISEEQKGWIVDKTNQYESMFQQVVEQEQVIARQNIEMHIRGVAIRDLIRDIIQRIRQRLDDASDEMDRELERAIRSGLVISLAIFIMALATIWVIAARHITAPLETIKAAATAIGHGNLTTPVPVHHDDEIGAVAVALRQMAGRLTEQNQALAHAHLYNANILSAITDTLIIVTPDGLIERVNRLDLLECDPQALPGTPVGEIILNAAGVPDHTFVTHLIQWHLGASTEAMLRGKAGRFVPVLVSVAAVPDLSGRAQNTILLVKDITTIKEFTASLEQAKREADAANQAKGLFVANMSHEIRTPMNAVLGMTHLCLQTETTNQQRDYLEKIYSSARGLLRVIDDILDFSKIEAGKMAVESVLFHLDDVLRDLATLTGMKAHQKGVEVIFKVARGVPRTLLGDPLRLGQVLTNLASNAIKFTESGEIVLAVERVEESTTSTLLLFKVRDTGIGMTEEQVRHLFHAFSQADGSTTRRYGGTGLGLSISRRLVELMGGQIEADSRIGVGTTFRFTARFGTPEQSVRRSLVTPDQAVGKRVLVVDDNQTSREVLQGALHSFSLDVETAASGPEGLTRLAEATRQGRPFDLLLIDWQMPTMNGVEVLHHLQADATRPPLLTILMTTTLDRSALAQQAQAVDLNGHLEKPVSISALFDTIMTAFGQEAFLHPRPGTAAGRQAILQVIGARVLLAEDNEINQQVARELLELAGITVTLASNGQEAVEQVRTAFFDLVLMDMQMPVMDGLEATRLIRHTHDANQLPIIAMTANVMADDISRCLAVGMNDHVGKPIDPNKLYVTLNLWIKPRAGLGSATQARHDRPAGQDALPHRLPALPGIDVDLGLARVSGNVDLFKGLLRKFAAQHAQIIAEIGAALAEGDQALAGRLAHTLKGVTGSIGANRLYALAGELEARIQQGTAELFSAELKEEMDFVLQSIARLDVPADREQRSDQDDGDTVDTVAVRQLLTTLRLHMERRRPKECAPLLETLGGMALPAIIVQEAKGIVQMARRYQFKEALAAVDVVLAKLDTTRAGRVI